MANLGKKFKEAGEIFDTVDLDIPDREEAMRANEGKPALSYILTFPRALRGFTRVCEYGEEKYAKYNYLKPAPVTQHIDCVMRHLQSVANSHDYDQESACLHVDALVWNVLRLSETIHQIRDRALSCEWDDRPEVNVTRLDDDK